MPPAKKAPKKPAAKTPAKAPTAGKGAAKKKTPATEPDFVRQVSPAQRKAAVEALAEAAGVQEALPSGKTESPVSDPAFVKEAPPGERKAAVEQLVAESGVPGILAKAPWKRVAPSPAAPQPQAATPPPRTGPKVEMTKAPLEAATGRSPPRVVILDTNALMMQFQFHVDIEREVRRILDFQFEIVVPRIVLDELARLSGSANHKEAAEARMALELAKTFRIAESPGDGDTGILRLAEKLNAVVVTNDKVLRARLRAKDIPNIYMRSRAFLTLEGHVPGM